MGNPSDGPLPHSARGITMAGASVVVANDKLILAGPDRSKHITIHAGPLSGVLDIHETHTAADGVKTYRCLYAISHANLLRLAQAIAPTMLETMKGLLRPLRPGWMVRNEIGAVFGMTDDEADLEAVTVVRSKKLTVDPERLARHLSAPEFVEDLYDLADGGSFAMFSWENSGSPRFVGIGFKYTDAVGRPRLTWLQSASLAPAMRRLTGELRQAAAQYGRFYETPPQE